MPRARARRRRLPLVAALALGLVPGGVVSPAVAAAGDEGGGPSTTVEPFGSMADGTEVERWTLTNGGTTAQRAVLRRCRPVPGGPRPARHVDNVVLGFDDLDEYVADDSPYFGALIGRYGNRIARGTFTLDGKTYQLPVNNGPNTLHGGPTGFDERVWTADVDPGRRRRA